MRDKSLVINIDNSDPANYPNGRIKDDPGNSTGTPVNEYVYGDIHENVAKLLRLYGINYNNIPDNETNGYQLVEAIKALASKNDYVIDLNVQDNVVRVNLKLNYVVENEFFIVKSTFNYDALQTTIRGVDNATSSFTTSGFKVGDYVRLIKLNTGWVAVRLVDAENILNVASDKGLLTAASEVEDLEGTIDNKATTPKSQKATFTNRVNGTESANYLANSERNGIYPKEHFDIVANIAAPKVRNVGTISGIDVGGGSIGMSYSVTGDIVSATLSANPGNSSIIDVTVSNTMTDTSYYVEIYTESLGDINQDIIILTPVFRTTTATTFKIGINEPGARAQNLRLHLRVVKL